MPNRIMTIISKDGNATEHYEKSVATEHISTMEPVTKKIPKIYIYKFVIVNLGPLRCGKKTNLIKKTPVKVG